MNIIGQRDLKPCPFCGHEPMSGEVRPATRKSPPLFGITCIHCGAEMTGRSVRAIQVMRHKLRKTGEARTDE